MVSSSLDLVEEVKHAILSPQGSARAVQLQESDLKNKRGIACVDVLLEQVMSRSVDFVAQRNKNDR